MGMSTTGRPDRWAAYLRVRMIPTIPQHRALPCPDCHRANARLLHRLRRVATAAIYVSAVGTTMSLCTSWLFLVSPWFDEVDGLTALCTLIGIPIALLLSTIQARAYLDRRISREQRSACRPHLYRDLLEDTRCPRHIRSSGARANTPV